MLTPWTASRMHWYGEEPFPWLGLGLCTLGLTAVVAAGWAAAWVFVTQFFDIDLIGVG